MKVYYEQEWYKSLKPQGQYVADLIMKYHNYFKNKDKKYKRLVYLLRITLLFLSMASTIILGIRLENTGWENIQVNAGLILSAFITFFTALSSFFNFEKYWMRNISIHIELNKLRDNFIYEINANKINDERISYYLNELNNIQTGNIEYWENAIKKI